MASLIFEPHNGFGALDPDGNPWPFGYISKAPGQPVFELGTPFVASGTPKLTALAHQMAAAPELLDVAAKIDAMWSEHLEPGQGPEAARSGEVREIWLTLRAALAKARGQC